MPAQMATQLPVIIAGGGIVGLTLAQALKKEGIPFQVFDRDLGLESRAAGWGITIHWALPSLEACLPADLFKKIDNIQVDPEQGRKDTGRFLFLDLETAKPRYIIPPSFRRRINRKKFRKLLADDIEINFGKAISGYESTEDGVKVTFSDGTAVDGSMLVAADGSASKTRRILMGEEKGKLNQLPLRFMGVTIRMNPEQIKSLRAVDPLLFQGSHPDTGIFLWFSTLSTPEVNGSLGTDDEYYEGQLNMSWKVKGPEDEVPPTDPERIAKMKAMAAAGSGFEKTLRTAVEAIPDDSDVLEIKLADWPTLEWPSQDGRVTLLGDAAHAMTMYRGEAANHGLTDAAQLIEELKLWHTGSKTKKQAIDDYETKMRSRAHDAVLLSRQACLDAHDLNALSDNSPLVSKRATVSKAGIKV